MENRALLKAPYLVNNKNLSLLLISNGKEERNKRHRLLERGNVKFNSRFSILESEK